MAIFECCNVLWESSISALSLTRKLAVFDGRLPRLKTGGGAERAIFILVSPSNVVDRTQIAPSFVLSSHEENRRRTVNATDRFVLFAAVLPLCPMC